MIGELVSLEKTFIHKLSTRLTNILSKYSRFSRQKDVIGSYFVMVSLSISGHSVNGKNVLSNTCYISFAIIFRSLLKSSC